MAHKSMCLFLLGLGLIARAVTGSPFALGLCHLACQTVFVGCISAAGASTGGVAIPAAAIPCYTACTACYITCVGAACLDGSNLVATEHGHKKVSDVERGDMVATFDDAGHITYTPVVRNVQNEGVVDFIEVGLDDGKAFNATVEHIVAVKRATGAVEIEQSQHLRVGDVMVTSTAPAKVVTTRTFQQATRWTLATEAGSVLVNGVLMTTICDDSFPELPKNFSAAISLWRQQHEQELAKRDVLLEAMAREESDLREQLRLMNDGASA